MTGAAHLFLPDISEGRPELGFFFKVPKVQTLDRAVLARAPCKVVVAREHEKDEKVLRSFIGSREVDDPTNQAFPTLEMLRRSRPDTEITVSSSNLEAHKELVRRGVGISILPLFMVKRELVAGAFTIVDPSYTYAAELEVVTRRGRRLSRNANALLGEVKRALSEAFR